VRLGFGAQVLAIRARALGQRPGLIDRLDIAVGAYAVHGVADQQLTRRVAAGGGLIAGSGALAAARAGDLLARFEYPIRMLRQRHVAVDRNAVHGQRHQAMNAHAPPVAEIEITRVADDDDRIAHRAVKLVRGQIRRRRVVVIHLHHVAELTHAVDARLQLREDDGRQARTNRCRDRMFERDLGIGGDQQLHRLTARNGQGQASIELAGGDLRRVRRSPAIESAYGRQRGGGLIAGMTGDADKPQTQRNRARTAAPCRIQHVPAPFRLWPSR
jgi:hypothetical protein